jgi:hypothetical protein
LEVVLVVVSEVEVLTVVLVGSGIDWCWQWSSSYRLLLMCYWVPVVERDALARISLFTMGKTVLWRMDYHGYRCNFNPCPPKLNDNGQIASTPSATPKAPVASTVTTLHLTTREGQLTVCMSSSISSCILLVWCFCLLVTL